MPVTQVQWLTQLNAVDLESICDATAEAIQNGIGFDWIHQPPRARLEAYWRGVMLVPDRMLVVGRFDGVIAGTGQLVKPSANNEAGAFNTILSTFFVAPWAFLEASCTLTDVALASSAACWAPRTPRPMVM